MALLLLAVPAGMRASGADRSATGTALPADTATLYIRVNQLGYLPDAPKVAVACALRHATEGVGSFVVVDSTGAVVHGPRPAEPAGAFGPCAATYRLDFSELREPGRYRLRLGATTSPAVRIAADAYAGAADFLLRYMRQQRSLWNPVFRDSVHTRDGIIVDSVPRAGEFIAVSGGWADAADYLQYVTTSANATFLLLQAWRDHPSAFGDAHRADGTPGPNGVPDVLDEARWGLDWLLRMYPGGDEMYNQIADDRDHRLWDLPTRDDVDYGWGPGAERPVYPCTGRPQGLFAHRNRSTGYASTAGKYAAAFALGAQVFRTTDPAYADTLAERARQAYALGKKHPGVCQTAPGTAPYYYEEDNWVDDMELGAAQLHALTGEEEYLEDALRFAAAEPVTPWMGRDTARHYQWYPWHNNGHFETWRHAPPDQRAILAGYYRTGLERVAARANNGFRVGIPFIWCSSNLMASFATQALFYRKMTGDESFLEYEHAALDWLLGTNPWGTSMIIGLPADGEYPDDPHSAVYRKLGIETQFGGLVDGPVYASIFHSLIGIRLDHPDEFAPFNTGHIVYHDDIGDYSTNEPIMDGTANLAYLLAARN